MRTVILTKKDEMIAREHYGDVYEAKFENVIIDNQDGTYTVKNARIKYKSEKLDQIGLLKFLRKANK